MTSHVGLPHRFIFLGILWISLSLGAFARAEDSFESDRGSRAPAVEGDAWIDVSATGQISDSISPGLAPEEVERERALSRVEMESSQRTGSDSSPSVETDSQM